MSTSNTNLYHEEYAPPFWPALILVFPILPIFWKYRVAAKDNIKKPKPNSDDLVMI